MHLFFFSQELERSFLNCLFYREKVFLVLVASNLLTPPLSVTVSHDDDDDGVMGDHTKDT